jgi:putative transposase
MPNYRRITLPGATYFFTVNLFDRRERLLTEQVEKLRGAVIWVRKAHPFAIDAWVVMPEHLHAIWTLPPGDADYALRWSSIKRRFSRGLPPGESLNNARVRRGERGIWQRRFWEHLIRDDVDFERHVDYIHFNPVKHGHAKRVADWPYSTFHRYVAAGIYPPDWGGAGLDDINVGERVW